MTPKKQEIAKMSWRDRYAYEARREGEAMARLTEQEIVGRIQRDDLGRYFQIWRVIGRKGTVKNAAMVLWEFLQRSPGEANMHQRYHCAAALLQILGMADPASKSELRRQVQWDHQGEEKRQQALVKLRSIIEDQLWLCSTL